MEHLRGRVINVPISVLDLHGVAQVVANACRGPGGYVGVCNVHSLVTAGRDAELKEALECSVANTADGMPLVWALRLLGFEHAARVYGQALMESLMGDESWGVGRHFLIGSTSGVQERLVQR